MKNITLGSLFDGIAGFPFAGSLLGITPVWASEIEPVPSSIARLHFPHMRHLGDITKLHGKELEPVDIITFGSPCTRLSVAGRHDGFSITFQCFGGKEKQQPHYTNTIKATDKYQYIYTDTCPVCGKALTETNESALFFHAVRIIEEMRESTNGTYPKFAVWENVPGAFSAGKGEDFHQVLRELSKAAGMQVPIPRPPGGRWHTAGAVVGDTSSIAWRVLDAQYWGVPQRRRRIFLTVDFTGGGAGEISFKPKSLRRHFTKGFQAWQEITGTVGNGTGGQMQAGTTAGAAGNVEMHLQHESGHAGCFMAGQGAKAGGIGYSEKCAPTMKAAASGTNAVPCVVAGFNGWRSITGSIEYGGNRAPCLQTTMPPDVVAAFSTTQITSKDNRSSVKPGNPCPTLSAFGDAPSVIVTPIHDRATRSGRKGARHPSGSGNGMGIGKPGDPLPTITCGDHHAVVLMQRQGFGKYREEDSASTLHAGGGSTDATDLLCISTGQPNAGFHNTTYQQKTGTLSCGAHPGGFNGQDAYSDLLVANTYTVRRLTPDECDRLNGYPAGWTRYGRLPDGETVEISDAQRYKGQGNSVAVPCPLYILSGIVEAIETM